MDGVMAMVARSRMLRIAALVTVTACQAETPGANGGDGGAAANFPPNAAGEQYRLRVADGPDGWERRHQHGPCDQPVVLPRQRAAVQRPTIVVNITAQ